MSDTSLIKVKTVFNDTIHRFTVPASVAALLAAVQDKYDVLSDKVVLKYRDDEGDLCSISTDGELREAVDVGKVR